MPWKPIKITKHEESWFRRTFGKKARFLLDENLDGEPAAEMRSEGWNTKTAQEAGLIHRSDEDVVAYAWRHNRILITTDADFSDERRFPPNRNPGIVIVPSGHDGVAAIATILPLVGDYRELYRGDVIQVDRGGTISIRSTKHDGSRKTTRYRFSRGPDPLEWVDE